MVINAFYKAKPVLTPAACKKLGLASEVKQEDVDAVEKSVLDNCAYVIVGFPEGFSEGSPEKSRKSYTLAVKDSGWWVLYDGEDVLVSYGYLNGMFFKATLDEMTESKLALVKYEAEIPESFNNIIPTHK